MTRQRDPIRSEFVCQECGYKSPKWFGFCPASSCDSAVPLVEIGRSGFEKRETKWLPSDSSTLQELSSLTGDDHGRIRFESNELNRVLGGGVVPGSIILLAGEPGIGKSTLLLQIAQDFAAGNHKVIYISGEESPHQIKRRSQRLGFNGDGVYLLSQTDVDEIIGKLEEVRPELVIVDSIQTLYTDDITSGPGNVAQVRECGLRLMHWAKSRDAPILLAGHMTKDGSVAGPRVLEHMVDTVMYLEAQDINGYRMLRSGKNRFGSTTEIGIFDMSEKGLLEVDDPSKVLLSQRYEKSVGTVLVPVIEGSRSLLLEIQALTSFSNSPIPRRVGTGMDYNRILMLSTVTSRRAGLDLGRQDIIVNVAGGFRVNEPAADLGVCLAIASSFHNQGLASDMVVCGEVGLSGEVRNIPNPQRRVSEAFRLGLTKCLLPELSKNDVDPIDGMDFIFVRTLRQAFESALGQGAIK